LLLILNSWSQLRALSFFASFSVLWAPGAIESTHGRGVYMMKAFMDEVRFEQGGAVVHMRKKSGNIQPDRLKDL
jgi:hypothetical protein